MCWWAKISSWETEEVGPDNLEFSLVSDLRFGDNSGALAQINRPLRVSRRREN